MSDWRTQAGKASSKKKTRACRRNAKQPRPGRTVFNLAVREARSWIKGVATFDDHSRRMLQIELSKSYALSLKRIRIVIDTALKQQAT